jgi:hypothetical protein
MVPAPNDGEGGAVTSLTPVLPYQNGENPLSAMWSERTMLKMFCSES